jgi:hypothetical protein
MAELTSVYGEILAGRMKRLHAKSNVIRCYLLDERRRRESDCHISLEVRNALLNAANAQENAGNMILKVLTAIEEAEQKTEENGK